MPTSVRLSKEAERRLDELARKTGRSKASYIREAIQEYLGDMEDVFLAEQRLEDLRAGRSSTVPLEDVMRRHGLED